MLSSILRCLFCYPWVPVLLATLTSSSDLKSQTQYYANNWYFGNLCGLSFSASPPAILAGSAMNANEGSSSISDNSGNLLFYTNGQTVWNRAHQVMANGNGLIGSQNACQVALIVQKPGSGSEYFVFTLGEFAPLLRKLRFTIHLLT